MKSAAVLRSSCWWIQNQQVQVTVEWEGIKGGFKKQLESIFQLGSFLVDNSGNIRYACVNSNCTWVCK